MNAAHRAPITITVQGLTFSAHPWYQRLDDYYAAHTQNLGVTVFADTIPAARQRLEQSLHFLAETALRDGPHGRANFKAYLRERGLAVIESASPPALPEQELIPPGQE